MTYTIMARTGTSQPNVVLATVITSYALSSILTGIVFFSLGALKLGSIVSFFPRHILVGCIGGVGFFLFVTGIEVSARIDGNLEYNLETLQQLFQKDTLALWIIPLALALLLRVATRWNSSPYLVPAFFISVIVVFYIVVAAVTAWNVPIARENGWIFGAVEAGVPFYHFYSYYGTVLESLDMRFFSLI
jgi:SulP family sulfate permease